MFSPNFWSHDLIWTSLIYIYIYNISKLQSGFFIHLILIWPQLGALNESCFFGFWLFSSGNNIQAVCRSAFLLGDSYPSLTSLHHTLFPLFVPTVGAYVLAGSLSSIRTLLSFNVDMNHAELVPKKKKKLLICT